jgi:hypothetical protein
MNLYIKIKIFVCSYNFHDMLAFTLCSLLCHSIFATNFFFPPHSARQGQSCASNQNLLLPLHQTRPVLCFKTKFLALGSWLYFSLLCCIQHDLYSSLILSALLCYFLLCCCATLVCLLSSIIFVSFLLLSSFLRL